jgi:hypothetical protein
LFVVAMTGLVLNTLYERPLQSLLGVGLVALGVPFFRWRRTLTYVTRPLRHLRAYGSTNKYRPLKRAKRAAAEASTVTQGGGIPPPCARAMKLAMTVIVKAMDTQR